MKQIGEVDTYSQEKPPISGSEANSEQVMSLQL